MLSLQGKAPAAKAKVVNAETVLEVSGDSAQLGGDGDEEESHEVKSNLRYSESRKLGPCIAPNKCSLKLLP